MPRGVAPNITNELRINDAISGDVIALYYRIPETEERATYQKSLFARKRNKVETRVAETRQAFGKKILTGFRDGDFYTMEGDQKVFFSADPSSSQYRPDWKDLLCTFAADLVEFLALQVFEGNSRDADIFSDDEAGDEPVEEIDSKN